MKLKFKILGVPFAKQSARFFRRNGFVKSYQPKEIVDAENNVRYQIMNQLPDGFKPFTEPVRITFAEFIFPHLATFSKRKMATLASGAIIYKPTKPDLDSNLFKGLIDAMQGIVFLNDSQIVEILNARKIYGLQPAVKIEMESI